MDWKPESKETRVINLALLICVPKEEMEDWYDRVFGMT